MWAIATALAASPLYNTDELTVDVGREKTADLRTRVLGRLKKHTVQWQDPQTGAIQPLLPRSADSKPFKELSRPALLALLLGLNEAGTTPGEYDLVFGDGEGNFRPVTVWTEGPKHLVVSEGPPISALPAGPPISEIVAHYGLAGASEVNGEWEPKVRGTLDRAYTLLTPKELARVADVALLRRGGKERTVRVAHPKGTVNTAIYAVDGNEARIEVYDEAVVKTGRFVGPVSHPSHPTLSIVLHELGHALADASVRDLTRDRDHKRVENNSLIEAYNYDLERLNADIAAYNRMGTHDELEGIERQRTDLTRTEQQIHSGKQQLETMNAELEAMAKRSPVAVDFLEQTGCEVTTYAKTSADEAFAEAFALFKLDTEALKRVSPAALEWFEAGNHLR